MFQQPLFCSHTFSRPRATATYALLVVGVLLALVCALACVPGVPSVAYAADATDETPSLPQVIGSFDKQSYTPDEQAVVTFRVTNETGVAWKGAHLVVDVPSTVKVTDPSAAVALDREEVAAGETMEFSISLSFEQAFFGKKLASTGDGTGAVVALSLAFAAAFSAVALLSFSRDRPRSKRARSTMSVFVSVVLVVGLAPFVRTQAHADEAHAEAEAAVPLTFQGTATCSSPDVSVTATLSIDDAEQVESVIADVAVADGEAVSAEAKYALVSMVSSLPFASDLSARTLTLGGCFEGLSISSVELTGEATAVVRIEGDPGAAGSDGVIVFGAGSFNDRAAEGAAAVSVERPCIAFDVENSTYDNAGTFKLAVSVENGRFSDGARPQDWLFAEGTGLATTDFVVDAADDQRGILTVFDHQADATAQMEALSAALSADKPALSVAPTALVGEPAVSLDGEVIAGRAVTLVEAASAVPYGVVEAVSVDHNGDGSLTVHNRVTLGAEGGSVQLSDIDQITLPGSQEDDTGLLENSAPQLGDIDADGFSFTFNIDADTVAGWYEPFTESGQTPPEAEAQFLDELTQLMCGHEVDVADGVVLNAFGIAQGSSVVYLSDADSLDELRGLLAASGNSSTEDAKVAFEALEKIVSAIGYFCSGDPADIAQGISGVLGLIATLLDDSPQITLEDIYDELQQMKGQLSRMETSIDRIAVELKAVDKRAGFDAEWYEVKWRVDHLSSYGGLYTTLVEKLDASDPGKDFANLTEKNQKLLNQYAKAIEKKDKLLNTTVYADTMDLGSLIVGEGKDAVSDYYDWLETYYNWDPETFASKDQYLTTLMMAYTYGYCASMAYLNVMAAGEDPDDPFGDSYDESKAALMKQASAVVQKLAGELGVDGEGNAMIAQKSFYRLATEPLANGQMRCLINDQTYSASSMLESTPWSKVGGVFPASVARDDVHLYKFSGTLNLAQWQQMQANLPQVRAVKGYEGASSLAFELGILGASSRSRLDETTKAHTPSGAVKVTTNWYYNYHDAPDNLVAVGDATYNIIKDQTAIIHTRSTTVDVFDLQSGKVFRGRQISYHEEKWILGDVMWRYRHDLYPPRVV